MCALIIKKKKVGMFIYVQATMKNGLTKRINLGIYHIQ
jgi:hypothetical protein